MKQCIIRSASVFPSRSSIAYSLCIYKKDFPDYVYTSAIFSVSGGRGLGHIHQGPEFQPPPGVPASFPLITVTCLPAPTGISASSSV